MLQICLERPLQGSLDRIPDPKQHRLCLAAAKAVARYQVTSHLLWCEWIEVTGPALIFCRQTAKQWVVERGNRYEDHLHKLLKYYGLDALNKNDRPALIWIMDHLTEVTEWRELQPNKDDLNSPQWVYQAFRKRATAAHDKNTKEKLGDIEALTEKLKILQRENDDLKWELEGIKMNYEDDILKQAKAITKKRYEKFNAEQLNKIIAISKGNKDLGINRTYPVIYADPPWNYDNINGGVPEAFVKRKQSPEAQYPTMLDEDIKVMPVAKLASPDAVLFLWTPSAVLKRALEVIEAWDFKHKSTMVWMKNSIGLGYYARTQHEILLIATRGRMPTPLPKNRPSSVVYQPRGKHSEKPPCFYKIIEQMYPGLDRIELFARKQYPGWDVFGNQAVEKVAVLRFSAA